jgi:RNA polymerase sigma-70 factor (ECF subfamily)
LRNGSGKAVERKREKPRSHGSHPGVRTPRASAPRKPRTWDDDGALVREILAGSREHFDLLYEAYFPRVYRFALKRLGDPGEAEDVTQEVFFTVFQALPSFAGESTLLVWIFGITRNKVNRRFRRPRPRLEPIDDPAALEFGCNEAPSDETVDARRILDRCERVIERDFTPLQRRIFHLKHLRRQSIRTIARALGKSEDAIKANLYRIRRTLVHGAPGLGPLIGR